MAMRLRRSGELRMRLCHVWGALSRGVSLSVTTTMILTSPKGRGTAYLKYFGPKRFEKYDWYMGSSRNGLNSYQVFTAGRWQFLILHLETDVPDEAIQWAKQVIKENRRLPTIVATHIYLDDDTRSRSTDPFYQKDAGNSGEAIWKKLIQEASSDFHGSLRSLGGRMASSVL